jgi:hypothetical protein
MRECKRNVLCRHPKPPVSGVSQWFRFIRWAKERVDDLKDACPEHVRLTGPDYPTFRSNFQSKVVYLFISISIFII